MTSHIADAAMASDNSKNRSPTGNGNIRQPGKKPGTTSGNEDYGSTEREPLDGHSRQNERKPHL